MKIDGTLRRTIAIIMPGQRLVAAGEPDQRVIGMAADGQFDRVGDRLARRQRRAHAVMAHGDAVGHGDGAELARRAAGGGNALLGGLRLAHQRDVAGRGLVPAGGDADERLVDLGRRQAHGVVEGPMGRALGPLRHMTAGQSGLDIGLGVHSDLNFPTITQHAQLGNGQPDFVPQRWLALRDH